MKTKNKRAKQNQTQFKAKQTKTKTHINEKYGDEFLNLGFERQNNEHEDLTVMDTHGRQICLPLR